MQIHETTAEAGHAAKAEITRPVVLGTSWNVACAADAFALLLATQNGVEGNAVPLKLIVPVLATPPVPTFTDPAKGVDPAVTLGLVPNPDAMVGRASTLN
jgi:hypothetical protein